PPGRARRRRRGRPGPERAGLAGGSRPRARDRVPDKRNDPAAPREGPRAGVGARGGIRIPDEGVGQVSPSEGVRSDARPRRARARRGRRGASRDDRVEKKEEKKDEEKVSEEEAAAGLGALFGKAEGRPHPFPFLVGRRGAIVRQSLFSPLAAPACLAPSRSVSSPARGMPCTS